MFRARVRKLPAVNAMRCFCSSAEASSPTYCATATPRTQVKEATKFHSSSRGSAKPAARSTMKSPSSCGSSCAATASEASKPAAGPAMKERPMAMPSTKLWSISTTRLAMPEASISWPCLWRCHSQSSGTTRSAKAPATAERPSADMSSWSAPSSACGSRWSRASATSTAAAKARQVYSTTAPSCGILSTPSSATPMKLTALMPSAEA
mmetsp:Transcript_51809/g.150488  ORF Transcript_51809/g.150488 Transcript_51809/m.150488 type:complete len:208 (-) Transcript_51809:360-983(-)